MPEKRTSSILSVDDNEAGRYAVTRILKKAGFDVIEAVNGTDALTLAAEQHPDLVLLDVNLPDMSGFEVCRRLKQDTETASIPVVHLSATFVHTRERVHGLEGGADGYLVHPIEPEELVAVIRSFLRMKDSQKALQESEERFHSMFERHNSVMLLIAPDSGKIIEANRAAARFYGRSQKELCSISIDEINIMSPEEIAAARMKAARDQENFFTFSHRLASGEIRVVEVHSSPIDIGGKTVLFSIVNDITERRRVEEALQLTLSRLESAMESGNIAWWEMDCTTGNVSFSERKARMLGYPAEQFSHYTDFTTLLHPDDSEPAMLAMRDHLSGLKKQYEVEYRIRTRDGGYRWFRDIGRISAYDPDSKPLKVTGLVIDITGRKRAEAAQVKTTRKLNVLSDLTRKDLTSQVFVLSGYLNMAQKHADEQDHVIKTLSKGEQALQSIHEIIEYTKDYQDMGIKPATWQSVNLALLFGLSHVSIGEIRHSLETGNLEIFADPLLEKVCQRLFENSLAHGGHVTRIRIWHTKTPDGITIFFEDDGIGISAEKKEQIFMRGEGATRFSMRSLIFVREILDITGITIRETGEPGKGARFEIEVPNGAWRTTGKGD
jgi:PAS domain S-box-containing protein